MEQRIIKFRTWHPMLKQIINVYTIDQQQHAGMEYYQKCRGWHGYNNQVEFAFDEVEWMQFTGLNDKNGKEIYEGDVIDAWDNSPEYMGTYNKQRGTVEYVDGNFALNCNGVYLHLWTNAENYEVLGNVYESPELLKPSIHV